MGRLYSTCSLRKKANIKHGTLRHSRGYRITHCSLDLFLRNWITHANIQQSAIHPITATTDTQTIIVVRISMPISTLLLMVSVVDTGTSSVGYMKSSYPLVTKEVITHASFSKSKHKQNNK